MAGAVNITLSVFGWHVARIEVDLGALINALDAPNAPCVNGNGNGHKPANKIVLRASNYWARHMLSGD